MDEQDWRRVVSTVLTKRFALKIRLSKNIHIKRYTMRGQKQHLLFFIGGGDSLRLIYLLYRADRDTP